MATLHRTSTRLFDHLADFATRLKAVLAPPRRAPTARRGALVAVECLEDRSLPNATPLGAEALVNTSITGEQRTFLESRHAIAMDAAGDHVVVWASQGQDGDGWGVFGQRYNAAGAAQGGEFRVNTTTTGDQLFPAVDMDENGGFVVVWSGNGAGDAAGVFCQRYDAAGVAQGGEFRVNSTTAGVQEHASVALASNGKFVVVWSGNGSGDDAGVFGQRYVAGTGAQGSEFRVNTTTAGVQGFAVVGRDSPGNFVVAWQSAATDGSWDIRAQRFSAGANVQGSELLVNTTTAGDQVLPAIARNADGDFVIAWAGDADPTAGVDWDIYARRYSKNGTAQGGEAVVNTTRAGDQQDAAAQIDDNGNLVVAWTGTDTDGLGIHARRASGGGAVWDAPFLVNSTTTGDQRFPSVGIESNGEFAIVWSGNGSGDTAGVFARRYAIAPSIIVAPTSGLQTSEGRTTAAFQVVLDAAPTADVTIAVSSSNPGEGTVSTSALVFTTGNWATPQTVTVTGVDDALGDGSVAYTVILQPAVSADTNYNGLNPADVGLVNLDNEAGIIVSPVTGLTTSEAGGAASFTVVLLSPPLLNVTIGLTVSDPTEATLSTATLTFTSTNWDQPQTVTVTGIDDAIADGAVGYTVVTASAASLDNRYNGLDAADVALTNADDDAAAGVLVSGGPLSLSEGGPAGSYTVVLTSQPTAAVTITINGGGQLSPDVTTVTFTPASWDVAQTVTVMATDDAVAEGTHGGTISHSISSADAAYAGLTVGSVAATIADNDSPGVLVTPSGTTAVTEGGAADTYAIVLASQPTGSVTITLSAGSNLAVTSSTLTFNAANWHVAQTVTISAVNDAIAQGSRADIISHAVSSSDGNYNGITVADVSVAVADNDTAGIVVTPTTGLTTTEAGGVATFTVVLTSEPTAAVTIGLSSTNLGEGTVGPSALTFTAADWNVPQTVTITGVNDAVADGDVGYVIATAGAVSSDAGYNGLDAADVAVTNSDQQTPGITVTPTVDLTTSEAGATATFSVVLDTQPTADVTITVSSSNTAEGTVATATLVFTSTDWDQAQSVTITGVDDDADDGDQTFTIVLGPAVSADLTYAGLDPADVVATNRNNDAAGVLVSGGPLSIAEGGAGSDYTVVLTSRPTDVVTVALSASSQLGLSQLTLTFTPTDWDQAQTVTVTAPDDAVAEGAHAATVSHSVSSNDFAYDGRAVPGVSVAIADNDSAGIIVTPTGGATAVTEGGPADTYTVVLASQPTADVVVTLNPPSGLTVVPISLTFTSADWNVAQTVTVTAVDDQTAESTQIVTIGHSAASSDANYQGMAVGSVTVTITDDDTAGVSLSAASGPTTEAGATATFVVVLTSRPTASVLIPVSTTNAGEGTVAVTQLTFTTANWNVGQTVTVTGVDDAVDDGDRSYTIVLGTASSADANYAGLDPTDVVFVNTDDDTAGLTVDADFLALPAEGAVEFRVVLESRPTAIVTITLSVSDPGDVGAAPDVVTFTPDDWDVAQIVAVSRLSAASFLDGTITLAGVSDDAAYAGDALANLAVAFDSDPIVFLTLLDPAVEHQQIDATVVTVLEETADHQAPAVPTEPAELERADGEPTEPADKAPVTVKADAQPPTGGHGADLGEPIIPPARPAPPALPAPPAPPVEKAAAPEPPAERAAPRPVVNEGGPGVLAAPPPPPAALLENSTVRQGIEQLSDDLAAQTNAAALRLSVEGAVTIGALFYVGYALLTSRAAVWLLLAFLARPVWKPFDVLEVIFAWEQQKERLRERANEDESLPAIAERKSAVASSR